MAIAPSTTATPTPVALSVDRPLRRDLIRAYVAVLIGLLVGLVPFLFGFVLDLTTLQILVGVALFVGPGVMLSILILHGAGLRPRPTARVAGAFVGWSGFALLFSFSASFQQLFSRFLHPLPIFLLTAFAAGAFVAVGLAVADMMWRILHDFTTRRSR